MFVGFCNEISMIFSLKKKKKKKNLKANDEDKIHLIWYVVKSPIMGSVVPKQEIENWMEAKTSSIMTSQISHNFYQH
jgi:hypothetical protein